MTTAQAAEVLGISYSTVRRLAQRLGLDGAPWSESDIEAMRPHVRHSAGNPGMGSGFAGQYRGGRKPGAKNHRSQRDCETNSNAGDSARGKKMKEIVRITERNNDTDALAKVRYSPFIVTDSGDISWREKEAMENCASGNHIRVEKLNAPELAENDDDNEWEYL